LKTCRFALLLNYFKLSFANKCGQKTFKNVTSVLFLGWVNSLLYSWQSFSLTTRPQKITTSAYMLRLIASEANICESRRGFHRYLLNWISSLIFKFAFYFGTEDVIVCVKIDYMTIILDQRIRLIYSGFFYLKSEAAI